MALNIITAEQRMAEKKGHKIVVCGQSGVGKTTLARTLDKDAVGTPVFTSFVFEDVSSFSDSELIVSRVTTTDELVTSEGFDGLDCVLNFHGCFL